MIRETIESYLDDRRNVVSARAYLKAHDERAVADAMFHLNRLAKHLYGARRATIYALKNQIVRDFYERGFCTSVATHHQVFQCWECAGVGEDDDGDLCWKCDGTGVYREHRLYQFTFLVHGRRFCWHQPASLVDWRVDLTEEPGLYEERELPDDSGSTFDVDFGLALVYVYLRRRGVPARELPHMTGLSDVARACFRAVMWRTGLRRLFWRLEAWLKYWRLVLLAKGHPVLMLTVQRATGPLLQDVRRHCELYHYLRRYPDPRSLPFAYALEVDGRLAADDGRLLGLIVMKKPQHHRQRGLFGEDGLPTAWQVLDLARVWVHPDLQRAENGHALCVFSQMVSRVMRRVQWDWLDHHPPRFPERPYHIELMISYCDLGHHDGTAYRASGFTRFGSTADGSKEVYVRRLKRPFKSWTPTAHMQLPLLDGMPLVHSERDLR